MCTCCTWPTWPFPIPRKGCWRRTWRWSTAGPWWRPSRRGPRRKGCGRAATWPSGEAAERILATAKRLGAECLFIASHGKGGLARLLLGSVAEEVVASSHIPVYVAVRDRLRR
ncbi:universal stress protein [Nitratidesulfovibrio liaohensis]|uniref:universal stress protein n=1 Tax=Nitratidesulfovibrio liaohensis TaxID=2604158 RepID=UPI0038CD2D4F